MNREIICGIYRITSPIGRIYIGQSRNCNYRKAKYKCRDCKRQPRLYYSIQKHGWDNHLFEVIHVCNAEELDYWETFYIEMFDTFDTDHGLNLIKGSAANGKRSQETKMKNREASKIAYSTGKKERPIGEKNGMYGNGHKLTGEKNGRYGMPVSQETRDKIRAANILHNEQYKLKYGKKIMSEDSKKKLSIAKMGVRVNIGNKHPIETINKMKETWRRKRMEANKLKM